MKTRFVSRFSAIVVGIFLFLATLLFSPVAFAGVTGIEGGLTVSSSYTISAGGSVTMYLYQSGDIQLLNSNPLSLTVTATGQASGSYPTSADLNGNYITQGTVGLDRITISPASGYTIANLIVDGSSKGPLNAYDFVGNGPFTFTVSFAQEVVQTPPPEIPVTTTPDPPTTTPKTTTKTVAPTTPVVEETPVAEPVAEVAPVETPAITPVVADTVATTPAKKFSLPLWLLLLILFLILLLLLLILFLLWKKRKKKEEKTPVPSNGAK